MSGSQFRSSVPENKASEVEKILQPILVDLIDLSLMLKQAHWNVRGALFIPLHEQLDRVCDTVREASDDLAERVVTIGYAARGLAQTIASETRLPSIRLGFLPTQEVVEVMSSRIEAVAVFIRQAIDELAELDPISQDLLIAISGKIEKHLWMLQSQHL